MHSKLQPGCYATFTQHWMLNTKGLLL